MSAQSDQKGNRSLKQAVDCREHLHMDAISIRKAPRRGFTLIEMLVVVVIIGILASLVTGAVSAARRKARIAAVAMEIKTIEGAVQAFKEKYRGYPPDFTDPAAVKLFLARAYPRYTGDYVADLKAAGVDVSKMDPASALVFWLGGMPAAPGSKKLIGFSTNHRNPFDNSTSRTKPFFEFDPRRLKLDGDVLRYYPDTGGGGDNTPYVYFRPRNGDYTGKAWGQSRPCGLARPYWDVRTNDWVNPDTFQIISAGMDGQFGETTDGAAPKFPTGENYWIDPSNPQKMGQHDNITNFSGGTLEDNM